MACLRALPADKVVDVQSAFRFGLIGGRTPDSGDLPRRIYGGTYNHVPVLTGTNHNEWRWSVANAELNSGKPLTADRYSAAIAAFYGTAMAPAIVNEYQVAAFPSPSEAVGTAETDGYMACER